MANEVRIRPGRGHKLAAAVFIVSALALFGQAIMLLTFSDETLLKFIRVGAVHMRETHVYAPGERPLTDEEIDKKIQDNRAQYVKQARETITAPTVWGMKCLVALLLIAMGSLILSGRPRPTRLLAWLTGFLLIPGSIKFLSQFTEVLKHGSSLGTPVYLMELLTVLAPVSLVFAFYVAFTWKANPAQAASR